MTIKRTQQKAEHPLIVKWDQAFIEAKTDGIPILNYRNPITGENDLPPLVFDNRVLKATMPQGTTMAGTALEEPHEDQMAAFEE